MIQNENQKIYFIIVVKRGNEKKYIAKDFFSKHHINCSIKLDKAKRFKTIEDAYGFWQNWGGFDKELQFVSIGRLLVSYQCES